MVTSKSKPQTKLPGRGWCFHRGAKLVGIPVSQAASSKDAKAHAMWHCPSCQNVASLTGTNTTALTEE